MKLNSFITVADGTKCKVYMKNFGEFFNNQVESAGTIILSRTQKMTEEKLSAAVALLREHNPEAVIITTPWEQITGAQILSAMEKNSLVKEMLEEDDDDDECCHDHHHDDHDHEHHHDHDDHDECCHDHEHHHDHDDHDECCHDHEHHHDHDDHDECCHDHEHHRDDHGECCHHHHHADEIFTSWGAETPKNFAQGDIERILTALDSGSYGAILRAKGIVPCGDGKWIHFDYVPQEHDVRFGSADYTGRLCVIGSKLDEDKLKELFGV